MVNPEIINRFVREGESPAEEPREAEQEQQEEEVRPEAPKEAQQQSGSGRFGFAGVDSYVNVTPRREQAKENFEDREQRPEITDGQVVEVYEDELPKIGEGYVDGEVVDSLEGKIERARLLPSGSEEDFIEADWDDLTGQEKEDGLSVVGEEFEDDLENATKELIEVSDEFGLQAAEAFTDIVYEDDDSFTDNTTFLDNDFVPDSSNFIANAFEDQPVAAPIYPSQAMPWGAPSETSGFGSNRDESFEADFALGGDI